MAAATIFSRLVVTSTKPSRLPENKNPPSLVDKEKKVDVAE